MNSTVLNLILDDISGGLMTKDTISSSIESGSYDELKISGLDQDTFEYLLFNYADKFKKILFWKCSKVIDLSALASLEKIESIEWFWNNKADSLWDISKNQSLNNLVLKDFTKLDTLDDLSYSKSLKKLIIRSPIHKLTKYKSLSPIENLNTLEKLIFDASLLERSIEPLSKLANLNHLHFPTNLFSTEQIAWLKSKVNFDSPILNAYINLPDSNEVIVVGKRKPYLNKSTDYKKLNKYIDNFNKLVKYYSDNPDQKEPILSA